MKLKTNKQATMFANTMLVILVVAVIGISGFMTDWFGLVTPEAEEEVETATAIAEATKTGDIASFTLSAKDNADTPTRIATTGYCWNVDDPKNPKGGGSYSLSASAGTTIKPVTVNEKLECVAFDANQYGIKTPYTVQGESDELTVFTEKANTTHKFRIEEAGSVDSTATITIQAGATKTFNKFFYEANTKNAGLKIKMICVGRDTANTTQMTNIEIGGLTSVSSVPYRHRNQGAFCSVLPTAKYIRDFAEEEFGAIKITTSGSFTVGERLNVTLIDEAYYASIDGSIQLGVETDATIPADVGANDIAFNITVSP